MKSFTDSQFRAHIIAAIADGSIREETNARGEIIIHTGIYEYNDTTLHDEPEQHFYAEEGMLEDDIVSKDFLDTAPTEEMIAAEPLELDCVELSDCLIRAIVRSEQ